MMPFEIARFLADNSIGVFDEENGSTNPANDIFIGIMPEEPDNLILINQYAGRQSVGKNLTNVERPGLQIKCRAKYYDDAYKKSAQVNKLLDQYQGDVSGTYYNEIRAIQSPFLLEQDANGRIIFVQNFYTDRLGD